MKISLTIFAWLIVMAEYIEKIARLDHTQVHFVDCASSEVMASGHICKCLGFNRCTLEVVRSSLLKVVRVG